jgi:hypothetical protein
MNDYLPLLAGAAFALAGFLLLTVQLAAYDSALAYRRLTKEIAAHFGSATCIFPDHKP